MNVEVLIILSIGIFLGFYVQTLVGFAGSLIALPILLFAMELPDAIAYISIFYVFSSGFMISKEWKNIDKKVVYRLFVASVVGVILGILVLAFAKPLLLKKALGAFILLYVIYACFGKKSVKVTNNLIFGLGILGGFFSGVFSTGGPLYVISVQSAVKNVKTFRATMIGVLGIVTMIRVPALVMSGLLNVSHIKFAVFVFPVFILAQFLGRQTFVNINEDLFKGGLKILLGLSGLVLLF